MKALPILLLLGVVGCVNPYERFYFAYSEGAPHAKQYEPNLVPSQRPAEEADNFRKAGYIATGYSAFSGAGRATAAQLKQTAKKFNADVVVYGSAYLGSEQVVIPMTTYQPGQTYNTTISGSVYSPSGGYGNYYGSATTTGSGTYSTQYVPVTRGIYRHEAFFFRAPSK